MPATAPSHRRRRPAAVQPAVGERSSPRRRRVLLLGDGQWAAAALRHLGGRHEVAGVVERLRPTDGSLARAAWELGVAPRRLDDVNGVAARCWIDSLLPDLLLSVSYDQIFAAPLLEPGRPPVINLHAGHPGRHRGRAVLCWQLLEGARSIDVAVMRVTRGVDRGPLLALATVALADGDYGHALARVSEAVPALIEEALAALDEGRQSPAAADGRPVTYPRRRDGDEWIDWAAPTEQVLRLVGALAPPNCLARTRLGEVELLVAAARPCADFPAGAAGAPGAVIGRSAARGLLVKTGDGAVWLAGLARADGLSLAAGEPRVSDRLGGGGVAELEALRRRVRGLEERLAALEGQREARPAPREASHDR